MISKLIIMWRGLFSCNNTPSLKKEQKMIVIDNIKNMAGMAVIGVAMAAGCKIRSKLDTHSGLNWTVIPEKIGHSFRF